MKIPQREHLRTQHDRTAPLRMPTHVGCAFSIDREFFFEIGTYDEKMDIWGSENLEMAFRVSASMLAWFSMYSHGQLIFTFLKVWQCGGSMELIPCSRVGHLFRISTYSFDGDASSIIARNNIRLVEVWMDDFKHFFYAANPSRADVRINLVITNC